MGENDIDIGIIGVVDSGQEDNFVNRDMIPLPPHNQTVDMDNAMQADGLPQAYRQGASQFADNLRQVTHLIVPGAKSYEGKEWYTSSDLCYLADRWSVPLVLFRPRGNHYILGLNEPSRRVLRGWKVIAYDPFKGRTEDTEGVKEWRGDLREGPDILRGGGFANRIGARLLLNHNYSLDLTQDPKLQSKQVPNAIHAPTQNDAYNCGPLALFQAVVCTQLLEQNPDVAESRRDLFQADTGIRLPSRASVLKSV